MQECISAHEKVLRVSQPNTNAELSLVRMSKLQKARLDFGEIGGFLQRLRCRSKYSHAGLRSSSNYYSTACPNQTHAKSVPGGSAMCWLGTHSAAGSCLQLLSKARLSVTDTLVCLSSKSGVAVFYYSHRKWNIKKRRG